MENQYVINSEYAACMEVLSTGAKTTLVWKEQESMLAPGSVSVETSRYGMH